MKQKMNTPSAKLADRERLKRYIETASVEQLKQVIAAMMEVAPLTVDAYRLTAMVLVDSGEVG